MIIERLAGCGAVLACLATPVLAQTGTGDQPPVTETRPATTTTNGDTGLWFVPTGEILPARKWSFSAYRVNFDYDQGFTDVSRWPVTFGVGLADRLELFGAFTAVTRIDRDLRPLFNPLLPEAGGVVNEFPFVNDGWSGNRIGDLWVGGKLNLTSQHRQQAAAFALRGLVKLPTGSDDDGAGTGRPDFAFDAIVSKELNQRVELSGFGGMIFRGDPDTYDLLNGIRWGVGVGLPTRRNLRLTAELHGEQYLGDSVDFTGVQIQPSGGTLLVPINSEQDGPINASLGLTWQGRNGVFAGAGINYNLRLDGRSDAGSFENETGDAVGFQFRVGYHPGVRIYVAPPPPPPPPPPVAENRPPTVRARCEPCTVEIGKTSTVTADATDPDGDALTYRWNTAAGTLSNPADRQSPWTAPMQEGPVPVTIEVRDPKGATATDAVTIQVIRPAVREFVFEDVHFDFDRYSLRPEATRALDEAIKALQDNPQLRLELEGHTCNIGTAEYNLALGERRAVAVRDYLASRGIGTDRLRTVTYGEERPKHDNAREETRRLNRRAALVVRVQR
ncbi:MAG TPA: OmpA family protein [Vicinamibacterales bacterium]|nr:OmpA family protein [Vicinamibacterales bacterium]